MGNFVCRAGARGRGTGTRYTTPCHNSDVRSDPVPPFRPMNQGEKGTGEPSCWAFKGLGGCYCPEDMPLDRDGILEEEETEGDAGYQYGLTDYR